jgi:flavin-binding protein dodecin
VLSDLKISAEEEAFLRRLRSELKLSEAEAAVMLEAGRERMRDVALEQASTSDPEFSKPRAPIGQFVGRSDESLEQAVRDAVSKARLAIPRLHWFEVGNISGYVDDEGPKSWHVTVRGGIKTS